MTVPRFLLPRRYHVLRPLGRGGQGSVFLVRDALLEGALLALKVVLDPRRLAAVEGSGNAADPLAAEFLVLGRLTHPALARVRDFGRLPGGEGAFFTSEYCPGSHLLEWTLARPFPADWSALYSIAAQALGALHAIHSAGYVHGDVKPAHILVEEAPAGPRVTVIDFGSARLSAALSASREATPAYLAPAPLGAGPPADLYALGMSLFHAMVGRLPFALGDAAALEGWRSSGQAARPSEWIEGAPRAASELVEKLTGSPRGERFRSAMEAMDFLDRRTGASRAFPAAPAGRGRLVGRDRELETAVAALEGPEASLVVIAAPEGMGKSRFLEEALRRAQVAGFQTVLATPADPARALARLEEHLYEGTPGPLSRPGTPEDVGAALSDRAAGARVLVALDGILDAPGEGEEGGAGGAPGENGWNGSGEASPHGSGDWFSFRAWAAFARGYLGRVPGRARLLAAVRRPERLRRSLGGTSTRFVEIRLEPLSRASLREMAVEFFRTSAIPEPVIDRLISASSGAPGRAREALLGMARAGARMDPLGMLIVPEVSESGRSGAGTNGALGPLHSRALSIAALVPEPLHADHLVRYAVHLKEEREDAPGVEAWERVLEDLVREGLLERSDGGYGPSGRGAPASWLEGIDPEVLGRIRAVILSDIRPPAGMPLGRDPDRLSALARAALLGGDRALAARAALHSIRRLRARRRVSDALALLRDFMPAEERGRAGRLLALRGAELALLDGRPSAREEAARRLDSVFPPAAGQSGRARALFLAAEIDERSGRFAAAAAKLEEALEVLGSSERAGDLPALWYEASARLASLSFALGLFRKGRDLLEKGKDLAARPPSGDLPACARALARFGSLWNRHGDPAAAAALFEASLAIARQTGRRDLEPAPLHELALIHAAHSRFAEAEEALIACGKLAEESGDRSSLLRVRVNLATLHQKRGDPARAESLFLEARLLADELGQDGPAAAAWIGLEVIRRDSGDLLSALRLGRGILRRFRGSRQTIHATAHFNLGEIYLALGRPEAARRHRARALATARACDYRFLVPHALLGLGTVRWAVGDLRGAGNRLRAAAGVASRPDHHLSGAMALLEGRLAAGRGDGRAALRSFGRAMFHARRAVSPSGLESALLALLGELVRRGDLARAGFILSRPRLEAGAGGAAPPGGRHRFLREALAARVPGNGPASGALLETVRRAEEAGEVLAALSILGDALRDPVFSGAPRGDLLARREALSARFLRRSPERDRAFFRSFSGAASGPASRPSSGAPLRRAEGGPGGVSPSVRMASLSGPVDPLVLLAERWSGGSGRSGRRGEPSRIESELGLLRDAIPARGLWVLNEPGSREAMFYAAGEGGPPLDLFSIRAPIVDGVRRGGGAAWGSGHALIALPGCPGRGEPRRVLYLELLSTVDTGGLSERVALAAALLGSYLRLRAAESARRVDRERLRSSLEEIHRLNALLIRGKGQIETAILTQRLLLKERSQFRDPGRLAGGLGRDPVALAPSMRALMERLRRIASGEIPVLLLGEHGVGKDLLARAIHRESPRRAGPFVGEVCAIPESLLESELFGHVRGAFTDAIEDRPGLLQLSNGGTLYLDEVAGMSPALQARLVRVLEERRARPIGAEEPAAIDFRLISSSSLRLGDLETSGALRSDLLYRLRGEVLEVPPLRERREDIPLLVRLFAEECARERGIEPPEIERDLLPALSRREWPGNVRQLENEVRRAILLSPRRLTRESFEEAASFEESAGGDDRGPGPSRGGPLPGPPLRAARSDFERVFLARTLAAHGGNASKAARALRISRRYLGILLDKHALRLADFVSSRPVRPPPEGTWK